MGCARYSGTLPNSTIDAMSRTVYRCGRSFLARFEIGNSGATMGLAAAVLEPVKFGDYLVERQLIDEGMLLDALADHWISGCRIGESVVRRGYLKAEELSRYLADFEGLHTVYV